MTKASRVRRILLTILWVGVVGFAVSEHVTRNYFQVRYQKEATHRQQLQQRLSELETTHAQLTDQLSREQQRTQELSTILTEKTTKLDQTLARLTEEGRTARELRVRLARLQQEMDQLQGELALTLEEQFKELPARSDSNAVELERVVVGHASSPLLEGRVVSVHPEWDFVVIDLGWDVVKIGDRIQILRDNAVIADAQIERVQESICAATVLPEWEPSKVKVNDLARVL